MSKYQTTRREFLQRTGQAAAVTALASAVVPHVHAAQDSTMQLALIGCGGRGAGATVNALATKAGPIKLVAMADVFPKRITATVDALKHVVADQFAVPEDQKFIGFDAYRKAIDCLRPGDVAILATPPAFRWVHFSYAIEKGVNVFMEKPLTVDGPTSQRMLNLGAEAEKKNLKVGVGLMCRHCEARGELKKRIEDGAIGDITMLRAYRMHGPLGAAFSGPKPPGVSELMWQVERFHSFLWASGGLFSDFMIHNIDECCWMKGAWPVKAEATGGRHYRGINVDQNFDTYAVEYTFPDGAKLFLSSRNIPGCHDEFASYAHGTRGSAIISTSGHTPAKCKIFSSQRMEREDMVWRFKQREPNPYQLEWDHLIDAIHKDMPYNEVKRGVEASLVTSMGRMAAHTGQIITMDQLLACKHEFAPGLDKLTLDSPSPLRAGPDGKYPVPQPGLVVDREY